MKANLNCGWKFMLEEEIDTKDKMPWEKDYSDDTWEGITLPHDWAVKGEFSKKYSSGTGYLRGGIGWYRLHFRLPEEMRGKKIWLVFDGVYKNSQVWCNSYYFGKRPFGYSTFRYDISDAAYFGEKENVVAVKVTHTDISDSRWFTGSGITRKVTLDIKDSVYVEPDSIFFTTKKIHEGEVEVNIEAVIANSLLETTEQTISCRLLEMKENGSMTENRESINKLDKSEIDRTETVLTETVLCSLDGEECKKITFRGTLNNAKLWSVEKPNLYRLEIEISNAQTESLLVGIREFTFDPDKGFFLNGENLKLKGVCLHHDAGCLGAAVTKNVWRRRLEKLKLMGCNAIRTSHNPHMPELYDLCDEMGFLMIDEAFDEWEGPKNKWSTGHNVYPPKKQGYYEDFPEWHKRDLQDMVKRDRNHPSIIQWSIGNEIDYPNDPYCHPLFESMTGNNDANKPAAERIYNPNRPNAERLSVIAKELVSLVKEVDDTRTVSLASAFPELAAQIGLYDSLDVIGYNYKEHLYEQDHKRFPKQAIFGSENSHTMSAWKAVRDNEYIAGQFLWTGIDYLGEAKGEWPNHGAGAGLLTLAGFEKTEYYFRQSLWTEKPMIKLGTSRQSDKNPWKRMSQSWNYAKGEMIEVRAYTNCGSAKLYVNDTLVGENVWDDEKGYITWVIPFKAGILKVIANGCEDSLITTGAGVDIKLELWNSMVYDSTDDLLQLEVQVIDHEGNAVVSDSSMLQVEVTGDGELIGLENGDLGDVVAYTASYRRAHQGKLLIYLRPWKEDGNIIVKVEGESLKTQELCIQLLRDE